MIHQTKRQLPLRRAMQLVASGQQRPQRKTGRHLLAQHCLRHRRGQEGHRDLLHRQPAQQILRHQPRGLIRNVNARAAQQVRPQLPHRRVKRRGRNQRRAIRRRHLIGAPMPFAQVDRATMLDGHTARLARGTARVDHVSQIVRRNRNQLPWRFRHRLIQGDEPGRQSGKAGLKTRRREDHRRLRVAQHKRNSFRRPIRIDGHVSSTSFQHREQTRHQFNGTSGTHRDQRA